MKIGEIIYHQFVSFSKDASVEEALMKLHENDLDYGVLKDKEKVIGYVTRQILSRQEKNVPLEHCCQSFEKELSLETTIDSLGEAMQGPVFLLFDSSGQHQGVIDSSVLLKSLKDLYEQNKEKARELDTVINFSSDEIYVTDGKGVTLMVNKAFEDNSGLYREEVLGKSVDELEKEGVFRPSVVKMVQEQKKQVSTLQKYKNEKQVLVTGIPIFQQDGAIFRIIVNARDTAKLNKLKSQLDEVENLKERYYQELIDLKKEQVKTEHITAYSREMIDILSMARKLAEVDSTVLILGETGVGKNVLASYIHDHSPRRDYAFVSINCGVIPENLLESELFGYEPGSFTGAHHKGKKGKIELAHGGTLFLDEIGDLPLSLQGKLLQVIQEGTLTRIGSNTDIKLDVRFLAATNYNLEKMVAEKQFREDLYYRINVVPVEIPPLRKRDADIVPLAQKFLDQFNKKYQKNKTLSPIVEELLWSYHWPGNIRELMNIVERLVITAQEDTIQPYHLPNYLKVAELAEGEVPSEFMENITSLQNIKEDLEKTILNKLYLQFRSTYKMAEILKVNQSTVARKLKKYNIKK